MNFLSIDDIDKTIFENIRRELVGLGYLPDILTSVDYDLDKANLKTALSKGIIEVFGVSSWQNRDMKRLSRFVIDRTNISRGQIGGGGTIEERLTEGGSNVIKAYRLSSSKNITYEIRFSTDNQEYELLANSIISSIYGQNSNKLCLSERAGTSELDFSLSFQGSYNVSSYDFYERVFTIEVKNIILEDEIVLIDETFAPILSIDFTVKNNQIEVAQTQS